MGESSRFPYFVCEHSEDDHPSSKIWLASENHSTDFPNKTNPSPGSHPSNLKPQNQPKMIVEGRKLMWLTDDSTLEINWFDIPRGEVFNTCEWVDSRKSTGNLGVYPKTIRLSSTLFFQFGRKHRSSQIKHRHIWWQKKLLKPRTL